MISFGEFGPVVNVLASPRSADLDLELESGEPKAACIHARMMCHCVPACLHVCIPACANTCKPTCIHAFICVHAAHGMTRNLKATDLHTKSMVHVAHAQTLDSRCFCICSSKKT